LALPSAGKNSQLWRVARPPDVETLKLSRQLLRAAAHASNSRRFVAKER